MKTITGIRVIVVWLTILMLAFFLAVASLSLTFCILDMVNKPDRIAPTKIKRLMKGHNTHYSECDWSGKCYFYRDGKRLRLHENI